MKKLALLLLLVPTLTFAGEPILLGGVTLFHAPANVFALEFDQSVSRKWSIVEDVGYIQSSEFREYHETYKSRIPSKFFVAVRPTYRFGHFEVGTGLVYSENPDGLNGSVVNFDEAFSYHAFSDHLTIQFQHISNAGLYKPNIGRNFVLAGWKFNE